MTRDSPAGDRVRLPVAAHLRLRLAGREKRAALPDIRESARARCTKRRFSISPISSRTTARCSRCFDGDHTFLNEESGEALRDSWRHRAASGGASTACRKYGRGGILGTGGDARQAVGRLAHQPDLAGQLGLGSAAGRASCRARPRTCRCCRKTRPRPRASPCGSSWKSTPATRACATCHVRIDPIGFALEAYDAIGRRRERDLGDRPDRHRLAAARRHGVRRAGRPAAIPGDRRGETP